MQSELTALQLLRTNRKLQKKKNRTFQTLKAIRLYHEHKAKTTHGALESKYISSTLQTVPPLFNYLANQDSRQIFFSYISEKFVGAICIQTYTSTWPPDIIK